MKRPPPDRKPGFCYCDRAYINGRCPTCDEADKLANVYTAGRRLPPECSAIPFREFRRASAEWLARRGFAQPVFEESLQ